MTAAPNFSRASSQAAVSDNAVSITTPQRLHTLVYAAADTSAFSANEEMAANHTSQNNNNVWRLEYVHGSGAPTLRLTCRLAAGTTSHSLDLAGTGWLGDGNTYSFLEGIYDGSNVTVGVNRTYGSTPATGDFVNATLNRYQVGCILASGSYQRFWNGLLWALVFDTEAVTVAGGADADHRLNESDVAWAYNGGKFRTQSELESRVWDTPGVVLLHQNLGSIETGEFLTNRGTSGINLLENNGPISDGPPPSAAAPNLIRDQQQRLYSENNAYPGGIFPNRVHAIAYVAAGNTTDRGTIIDVKRNNLLVLRIQWNVGGDNMQIGAGVPSGDVFTTIPLSGTGWDNSGKDYSFIEGMWDGANTELGINRNYGAITPAVGDFQRSANRITIGAEFNSPHRRYLQGRVWLMLFDTTGVTVAGGAEADHRLDEADVAWAYDGGAFRSKNELETRNWQTPGVVVFGSYLGGVDDFVIDRGVGSQNLLQHTLVDPIVDGIPPKQETAAVAPVAMTFQKMHAWSGERTDAQQDADEAAML